MWRKTQITDDTAKLKGFLGATPHLIRDFRWTVPTDRALQLFHTAGGSILIGGPQPYAQQMLARSPAYTTVFERLTCKSLGV
jgi:hypothetical protein